MKSSATTTTRPGNLRSIMVSRPVVMALTTLTFMAIYYFTFSNMQTDSSTAENVSHGSNNKNLYNNNNNNNNDDVNNNNNNNNNYNYNNNNNNNNKNVNGNGNSNSLSWLKLSPEQVESAESKSLTTDTGVDGGGRLGAYPGRRPKTVQYFLHEAHQRYERMLKKRQAMLDFYGWGKSGFTEWHKVGYFWLYFPASFSCPHEIERVGPLDDGGKWVCGLSLYEEKPRASCVMYSFGVNKETRFEGEMLDRTDCEIWAYDASVNQMGPETQGRPKVHFTSVYVGKEDRVDPQGNNWKTIKTLMAENGHDWIDILKIDIEHNEYQTLNRLMDDYEGGTLPFSQLLIEIHVDPQFILFPDFKRFWERLEGFGVYPWWTEVNLVPVMFGDKPYASEYCWINTKGGAKNILIHNY